MKFLLIFAFISILFNHIIIEEAYSKNLYKKVNVNIKLILLNIPNN